METMIGTTTRPKTADVQPFVHTGLLYNDMDAYIAGTVPAIRDALVRDDAVMVAVPADRHAALRDALGLDVGRIRLLDMTEAGRNPGWILPGVLLSFAAKHPDSRVFMIGEPIWAHRTAQEYPACVTHDALINIAFADRDATILCPYDTSQLPAGVIEDSYRTHPTMTISGRDEISEFYTDPLDLVRSFNEPLPAPPDAACLDYAHEDDLFALRRFVRVEALAAGLSDGRVDDLTLAVTELTTNTLEHAGAPGRLSTWTEGDAFICQVSDAGLLTDPLAGRRVRSTVSSRGRGLALVNGLCDLVRLHTSPEGTTFRLFTYR